jgi:LacI family transcriptional regulator, repressor for deo operon, udp, cdd, tsx, nupC, and nupG
MNATPPKYVQIKNRIKEGIRDGSIKGKLPGERQLVKEFEASYMTVRKAISDLVDEGILHKNTTKGTFVSTSKMTPKTTYNIGFFLDESIKEGISSPYYSLIFNALEKEVKEKKYNLTLFSTFDDLNPLNSQKKIDGVIITCFPRLESKIQELKDFIPVILLDNTASDKSIPSVTIDNFNSSREAVRYLNGLGHKRIAFITGLMDSAVCNDRYLGYADVMGNLGIRIDKDLVFKGDFSYESGEIGAEEFLSLKNPPTAIVCANDSMAIGAMKVIQEKGLRIPDDISVIGFDDIKVSSRVFPSLTTLAAPVEEIASKTIDMLLSNIDGNDLEYKHIILPAKLIIRNSCGKAKK